MSPNDQITWEEAATKAENLNEDVDGLYAMHEDEFEDMLGYHDGVEIYRRLYESKYGYVRIITIPKHLARAISKRNTRYRLAHSGFTPISLQSYSSYPALSAVFGNPTKKKASVI